MTVVTLNGERRELGERATVEAAVLAAGALDGEVVPRGHWATTAVREGQQVEELHAVPGGS